MRYPVLDSVHAEEAVQAKLNGYAYPFERAVQVRGEGPDFDDEVVGEILDSADEVRARYGPQLTRGNGGSFESELVEILHRKLHLTKQAAADSGFWRWLSVRHFFDLINYRHPPKKGKPAWANFGTRSISDGLLWRIWFRSELVFDDAAHGDPYWLAKRGDQDFWRSHVLRVRYGGCRPLARALVRFQYPDSVGGTPRLKTGDESDGIRMLAKRLRRRQTVVVYECLNNDQLESLLEELSDGLARNG